MRHPYSKLFCLALVLAFALTGCNLIKVDAVMQSQEDMAKMQKQYSTVIAEYDGGNVDIFDVTAEFSYMYSYYSQMYSYFYGSSSLSADDVTSLQQSTLQSRVQMQVIAQKAAELGVALTDEELAESETTAQTSWDEAKASYLEQATGETDEEKQANAEYNLYVAGYTYDKLLEQTKESALMTKVEEALKAEVAEVTDEELKAAYDEKVTADQDAYTATPGKLGSDMTNADTIVAWMPEGYRTVKHILVKPADDVLTAVTDARSALKTLNTSLTGYEDELVALNDGETAAEATPDAAATPTPAPRAAEAIQADIDSTKAQIPDAEAAVKAAEDACLASVQDKVDAINARLTAGEDFAAVMADVGEDPGMQADPAMTTGYYVSAASTNWDTNFRDAAMALVSVGDVSEPVISTSGVHIIRYEADVAPGAVSLETIHDALYASTLETMQQTHYDETVAAWVEAANPQYYYDKWVYEAQQ